MTLHLLSNSNTYDGFCFDVAVLYNKPFLHVCTLYTEKGWWW